jgi:hypothetical protein
VIAFARQLLPKFQYLGSFVVDFGRHSTEIARCSQPCFPICWRSVSSSTEMTPAALQAVARERMR